MSTPNYNRTRFACYYAYLAMSTIFVLPPSSMYNIIFFFGEFDG